MHEGLISIIVPVYNVENYLEQCIKSVVEQTYKDLEIILIDDGSTDKSGELCDKWSRQDSRITVFHSCNRGVSAARNKGLSLASGEFIYLCDSDDYFEKDAIEQLYHAIMTHDADLVVGNYRRVDEKSQLVDEKKLWGVDTEQVLTKQQFWDGVKYYMAYVMPNTKLYRRELWKNVSFLEGIIHEDQQVLHYIYKKCHKIVGLNKVIYNYRVTPNSIMTKAFRVENLDYAKHLVERIDYFLEESDSDNALFFWGVGSRQILYAYEELDFNDTTVKTTIQELKCSYGLRAKKIRKCIHSAVQKARLLLFEKCFVIYRLMYKSKGIIKKEKNK